MYSMEHVVDSKGKRFAFHIEGEDVNEPRLLEYRNITLHRPQVQGLIQASAVCQGLGCRFGSSLSGASVAALGPDGQEIPASMLVLHVLPTSPGIFGKVMEAASNLIPKGWHVLVIPVAHTGEGFDVAGPAEIRRSAKDGAEERAFAAAFHLAEILEARQAGATEDCMVYFKAVG